ncbi:hypothetical protein IAT38_005954 [Cryptococcus sp. DSM 104549]
MAPAKGLAALREARAKGGRLSQWKPEESEIYDSVTEDQYRSVVGSRLDQDDFIEDDDGQGDYVDNGEEDWGGRDDEEGEDEDDFEGEDEELRKARKIKKARAKARAEAGKAPAKSAKPKPKSTFSDYARPAPSNGAYRPARPAVDEEDFMAGLMSSVTAAAVEPASRKRKSSPEIPSSDGFNPSSEGSTFSYGRKRYGAESDDEPVWDPKRGVMGKKPRVSDATVTPGGDVDMYVGQENEQVDDDMEVDDPPFKTERADSSDDDEIQVRKAKPLSSAATKVNGAGTAPRRKVVNSSAIKHVKREPSPEPVIVKGEPDVKVVKPSRAKGKATGTHWSAIQASLAAEAKESDLAEVAAPVGSIKTEDVLEADESLRFYWLDFMEEKGVIRLIGKVADKRTGKFVSCCLTVNGIQRKLYVKPRRRRYAKGHETDIEVTHEDVLEDWENFRMTQGIDGCRSRFVDRKYAFEDQTVEKGETEWLEVSYGFDEPEISPKSSSATFSHVFGTSSSAFELFVIDQKIMGPCWLDIKGAYLSEKSASWCKIEFTVDDPEDVNPFSETDPSAPKDTPPLTIVSIAVRTIVNHRENKTEILAASVRTWESYNIDDPADPEHLPSHPTTVVRPIESFPPGFEQRAKKHTQPFQTVKAERALLNSLLATLQRQDPDVIVGHNFLGNGLEALLYRMKELKVDHWSRLGRFRRNAAPKIGRAGTNARLLAGRLVADLSSDAAKGMIASTTWSLTEMTSTHLEINREDIDPEETADYFDGSRPSPDKLIKFIDLMGVDTYFQMAIACKVQLLPLTKQLTILAGNSWNLTLNGGRAIRNEFILLHEFNRLGYVCPDKAPYKAKGGNDEDGTGDIGTAKRGKAKYTGGLVFEPKRGLWDTYIIVMDFNSLYPSIIQEYNIDFTTVDRDAKEVKEAKEGDEEEEEEEEEEDVVPKVPAGDVPQGVLPRIIATLVNRRRQVKGLMKDKSATPAKIAQYDIRQQALKLTANSMYGCLGFVGSRFASRPLAALTTHKGREILTHTRELAESLSLDVVYGDTDSVFVNSNVTTYPEAQKIANDFKRLVNERYKLLEIDLDSVFERILLLNKKKYAAVKIDESGKRTTEVKGLDMKRREFSKVSKDTSAEVLSKVLSGEPTEIVVEKIHELLTTRGEEVRNGEIPLDDFIIFKRLGKNPEDYPDKKSQPHVQVALRMKAKGTAVKAGDVIPYIMCLGEGGKSGKTATADRAFHPDDVRKKDSELRIDYDFYLDSQILQPVLRMCEIIEGTERARLAECLGLDPLRFAAPATSEAVEKEFTTFESQIPDKERFRDCKGLLLRCPSCSDSFTYAGPLEADPTVTSAGVICALCKTPIHPASIQLQLENALREYISKYYLHWAVCDGEGCGVRTRSMMSYGETCLGLKVTGCRGKIRYEYTDTMLYNQMLYFRSLFDSEKMLGDLRGSAKLDEIRPITLANQILFTNLLGVVDKYLDKNGRRWVDLGGVFNFWKKFSIS